MDSVFTSCRAQFQFTDSLISRMAEQGAGQKADQEEKEGGEEDEWEYYDDDSVLPDFWQDLVRRGGELSDPVDCWLQHFTRPLQDSYGWNIFREHWRVGTALDGAKYHKI